MIESLYHLPVVWMALVVFLATALVAWGIYAGVLALATGDRALAFKAVLPAVLTPLAVVFGLLVGFLAAQVWSEADRASAAVIREASALHTIVVLAGSFPVESEARIRAFVSRHIKEAVSEEWPAMARQRATLTMLPTADAEALQVILSLVPESDVQAFAKREMAAALQSAVEARRQRIEISRSTINWVKWTGVTLPAVLILLTIAILHSDNRKAGAIAIAIYSISLAACIVLIAAHSRPFTGEISVGSDLLLQVMPQEWPQM